jgi:hypothetical protein
MLLRVMFSGKDDICQGRESESESSSSSNSNSNEVTEATGKIAGSY